MSIPKPQRDLFEALRSRNVPRIEAAMQAIAADLDCKVGYPHRRYLRHMATEASNGGVTFACNGYRQAHEHEWYFHSRLSMWVMPVFVMVPGELTIDLTLDPIRYEKRWFRRRRIWERRNGRYARLFPQGIGWRPGSRYKHPLRKKFEEKGYSAEVFDLRTMQPVSALEASKRHVLEVDVPRAPLRLNGMWGWLAVLILGAILFASAIGGPGWPFLLAMSATLGLGVILGNKPRLLTKAVTVAGCGIVASVAGGFWYLLPLIALVAVAYPHFAE